MKLNIVGQLLGTTGYSIHTRSLFNALVNEGIEISLDVPVGPGWELQVNDQELRAVQQTAYPDAPIVFIGQPQFWEAGLVQRHKGFYGFVVWEGDRVPQYWKPMLEDERVDGLLVPSKHVEYAIKKVAPNHRPIHRVPHGIDPGLWGEQGKPDKFTFVANKGWNQGIKDRGGLQWVFKAFAEEFSKDEPVELKVKINMAYAPQGWDVGQELEKLQLPEDRPRMQIAAATMDERELPQVYQGHVLVAPAMAEAFNLPVAEAMACGLPSIVTNFGGQLDYVTEDNGFIVPGELHEVTFDWQYEGVKWMQPNIDELRRVMRFCYEHPEICAEKGLKAMKDVRSAWTWSHSAKALIKALGLKP